jgi:hypothetical protein
MADFLIEIGHFVFHGSSMETMRTETETVPWPVDRLVR